MLRDKIADILAQHETLDKEAPYRVMPSDSPEWCKIKAIRILALIDAQRCVWTHEEIWYPCLYYTSCGKFMREEFTDDKPFCPFCGKRIEVKEATDESI